MLPGKAKENLVEVFFTGIEIKDLIMVVASYRLFLTIKVACLLLFCFLFQLFLCYFFLNEWNGGEHALWTHLEW